MSLRYPMAITYSLSTVTDSVTSGQQKLISYNLEAGTNNIEVWLGTGSGETIHLVTERWGKDQGSFLRPLYELILHIKIPQSRVTSKLLQVLRLSIILRLGLGSQHMNLGETHSTYRILCPTRLQTLLSSSVVKPGLGSWWRASRQNYVPSRVLHTLK